MFDLQTLILLIPVLLFSLTIHEYAHGWVAYNLGDPTPKLHGRLTLNPIAHLDPMGTLVLIVTRRFGWAKPVPVNPSYFENPRKGMMTVGLAGPLSNFTTAFIIALPIRMGLMPNIPFSLWQMLILAIQINIALGLFNLIPVPPLDGSKILMGILPPRYDHIYRQMESYGPILLLLLVFTGMLGRILFPLINIVYRFFLFGF